MGQQVSVLRSIGKLTLVCIYFVLPLYVVADLFLLSRNPARGEDPYDTIDRTIAVVSACIMISVGILRLFNLIKSSKYEMLNLMLLALNVSAWLYISRHGFSVYWIFLLAVGQIITFRYLLRGALIYAVYIVLFEIFYLYTTDATTTDTILSNDFFAFPIMLVITLVIAQMFNDAIQKHYDSLIHARQRYLDEHQLTLTLVNSINDSIIAVDTDMNITVYNSSFLDLIDANILESQTPLNKALKLVNSYGDSVDISQRILESGNDTFESDELMIPVSEEEKMNVLVAISPILDYESEPSGYTIVIRDITRQKSLEQEKDEFISVVSHELRTPITVAEGGISNVKIMLDKQIPPSDGRDQVSKMVNTAHEEVLALAEMVNDLSTLSRAERNIKEGEIETINLHEFIEWVVNQHKKAAKEKDLKLKPEIDGSVTEDDTIISNKLYLNEIMQNFVTNAVKYTQKGSVTVGLKPLDEDHVQFYVRDTGIGISKSDQRKIFDKFFRSEDYRTRESNGTGLGLYVTKKLASMIGAKISVNSELNKGTTLVMVIPKESKD